MVGGILDKHRADFKEYYGETDEDEDVILDNLGPILASIVMLVGNVKRSTDQILSMENYSTKACSGKFIISINCS